MSLKPELGQVFLGNPTGEHSSPLWFDALMREILREIERVFWNRNQREWDRLEDPRIPGIRYRAYYWGDGEEAELPNFNFGTVEVRWYKYPMRSASLNVEADPVAMVAWFESVMRAIGRSESCTGATDGSVG